uniref:Rab proteins geranylgeranyltransferase component A n=1 Tax=Cynoglossus semilaevis TaxID=244447 RepID=A0A3P8WYU8_CYNSE
MAAVDLPSEFDVVILGTGLVESVVAAACSRVGQRVLHLDRRSYYAGNWASFTFNGLQDWIRESQEQRPPEELQDWSSLVKEGEKLMYLPHSDSASISNIEIYCFARFRPITDSSGGDGTGLRLFKPIRVHQEEDHLLLPAETWVDPPLPVCQPINFSSSLGPFLRQLMFSRGSLVDLLIKSNVSRYAEFKNVSRVLTCRERRVQQVCPHMSLSRPTNWTVFLTSGHPYRGRPYLDFLSDQQLGENLQHFLLHSIAMVTENTPTEVGLAATRHFLRCLGRYGNTPFLFPVYGLGEIPQCFCRMSAVFGGVYCLRHSVHCLLLDKDNRCKAVIDSRGQRISCGHFVVEEGHLTLDIKKVSLVTVPPITAGAPAVKMVELCSSTMTCIPGTYLVHLTCQSVGSAYQDLSPVVTRMFKTPQSHDQDAGPSVLWCLYFNMVDGSGVQVQRQDLPSNVYMCSGPDGALGHEHAISQVICILPEEEFCPPAPNPEDIIYDGDSAYSTGEDEQGEELQEGEDLKKEEADNEKTKEVDGPNDREEQKQMVESCDQGEELQ